MDMVDIPSGYVNTLLLKPWPSRNDVSFPIKHIYLFSKVLCKRLPEGHLAKIQCGQDKIKLLCGRAVISPVFSCLGISDTVQKDQQPPFGLEDDWSNFSNPICEPWCGCTCSAKLGGFVWQMLENIPAPWSIREYIYIYVI